MGKMMPITLRLVGLVLLAPVVLASAACAATTSIEPTSLRAYNDVESASLDSGSRYNIGQVTASDDVQLRTTDGRLLSLSGKTTIYIDAVDGTYEFYPPLH